MKNHFLKSLFGFFVGLSIALSLTLFVGENPFSIAVIIFKSAFGSNYDFGLTLFYTTPLIFAGLSVAIAFHAGLFNIGGEGQLTMASLAAVMVGIYGPHWGRPWDPLLAIIAALFVGSLWGWMAGWLRAYRGSHEVIVTIMLNFIAAGISSWFVLNLFPNPDSQNPESAKIYSSYFLQDVDLISKYFPDTPVNHTLIVGIIASFVFWFFLMRTRWGFALRASGKNPAAAERAGISEKKMKILAMTLAGLAAAFIAENEILGSAGQFKIGFSPGYGFMGIAVALLAANNPLGILFSALLLGALHKGASDLDLETTTITRDFSKIIQSLIILGVSIPFFNFFKNKKRSP